MWNRTTISQTRILPLDHKDILNCSNTVQKIFYYEFCEVFALKLCNDDTRYVLPTTHTHSAEGLRFMLT